MTATASAQSTASYQEETPSLKALWQAYLSWIAPYKGPVAFGLLMLLLTNGCAALLPWVINDSIQQLQAQAPWLGFARNLGCLALLSTVLFAVRVASRRALLGLGRDVEAELRQRLFERLLRQNNRFFQSNSTGDLLSRVSNDLRSIRYLVGGGTMLASNSALAYATKLPVMLLLSPELTLCVLVVYPLCFWGMSRFADETKNATTAVQEELGALSSQAQESLSAIAVIQGYVKEDEEGRRFEAQNQQYQKQANRLILNRARLLTMMSLAGALGLLLAVSIGSQQVLVARLELGDFVAMMLYVEQLNWPTLSLGWFTSMVQQSRGALVRLNHLFNAPTELSNLEANPQLPAVFLKASPASSASPVAVPGLQLSQLAWRFEDEQAPLFEEVNAAVPPGSLVVLSGPVGAGKTTLLRLLARQLDPAPGQLWFQPQQAGVAAVDATTLSVQQHRCLAALMPQWAYLFSQSVGHNLSFATNAPLSQAQQWHTLDTVALKTEVEHLPQQLDTLVGERGLTLSGGQRQRLTLGRTLLASVPIVLLDDPFANVDAETEERLLQALLAQQQQSQQTFIIATHRLSILPYAQQHWHLEQGGLQVKALVQATA